MRSLLSMARLTLANAIRMKVAVVIIVFLAIVIPSLPFVLKTDETQMGHVQITLTYGLGMVFFLLSIMTVFIGAASISNEKAGGQMQLLDTKPIGRWQIILGKWLGIMALNIALIVILGGVIYGLTRFIGRSSAGTEEDQRKIRNSVFTARLSARPELPPGIQKKVEDEFQLRIKEGRIPKGWETDLNEYKEHLAGLEMKRANVVPSGIIKIWEFKNIEVDRSNDDGFIFLRYKARTTEARKDRTFRGLWIAGDRKATVEPFHIITEETTGSPHEFAVPVSSVKPDGTLDVEFRNLTLSDSGQEGISVVFDSTEGLALLYERTGFLSNYIRYFLVVLIILGFIAILSVVCSSFMSFPVAALLVFSIILNCYGLGTFKEFAYARNPAEAENPTAKKIGTGIAKTVYTIMSYTIPDLSKYSTLGKLNTGIYIPTSLVFRGILMLILLSGGIVYIIGCIIFYREELG